MLYGDYLRLTKDTAVTIGGEVISLAGGYYGIQLTTSWADCFVIVALDLDGESGWAAWSIDDEGERTSADIVLGWPSTDQLAELARDATVGE